MSKSDKERYGSCLVKDGHIIGMGWNRAIAHPNFRLERTIRMGYANHSEIEAMDCAPRKRFDLQGADVYCSGYFPFSQDRFPFTNTFFIKRGAFFTCIRCPPYMTKFGVENIYVPTLTGWQGLSIEDALKDARKYTNGTYENRVNSVKNTFPLEAMDSMLLTGDELESLEKELPLGVDELSDRLGL